MPPPRPEIAIMLVCVSGLDFQCVESFGSHLLYFVFGTVVNRLEWCETFEMSVNSDPRDTSRAVILDMAQTKPARMCLILNVVILIL